MMDFEKLGVFYLGKTYDLLQRQRLDQPLLYDARDLTTHAVCVGMTGSGKTGLCIDLLEEAAIDHIPAIIIDPKGDITNLLLTFPDLSPSDFLNWINVDDARRKGVDQETFAAQQADLWRKGLADWGQSGDRIRRLRASTDFVIYTPGSESGLPVSILQSFAAPSLDWASEAEVLRERIQATVSALLNLIGIEADPVRSREHILLSNLFEHYWRQGEDLDLPKIILAIQNPPIQKLGVFDIETFFPSNDRFALAMNLNNILAAPSFQGWMKGQPMDIAGFLNAPDGRSRHAVFYIAHLSDAERMFFVTILLNQVISWMRSQPGTAGLRALIYMDEIFGFFPPVSNPPSKTPLLTLMKQGRAFGIGVVLTTQNPGDLDYKGLSNAGTWFIGRLQSDRDKERLLDGLEGVSAQAGQALNRRDLDKLLSSLGKRIFLLHSVHTGKPVVFQTRWAMSYLRGPLTRLQIRDLMAQRQSDSVGAVGVSVPTQNHKPQTSMGTTAPAATAAATAPRVATDEYATVPPAIPSGVQQVYLPLRKGITEVESEAERLVDAKIQIQDRFLLYVPMLLGMGRVHFIKQRKDLNVSESAAFSLLAHPPRGVGVLRWEQAEELHLAPEDLLDRPEPNAHFDLLPEAINESKEFTALRRELEDHLYRTRKLLLQYSPVVKIYSNPDESEQAFGLRLKLAARELRDAEVDTLTSRYESKLDSLQDRLRRAKARLEKREVEARARKQDALLSAGETVLSLFSGRRRSISSAANKMSRVSSAKVDLDAAEEQVAAYQSDIEDLQQELKDKTDEIIARWESELDDLEELPITPRRADIEVNLFVLAWCPQWQLRYTLPGSAIVQTKMIPAY